MNIEVTVRLWHDKETGEFIAHAIPIDVMSFGKTPDEAKSMLRDAINGFVETARMTGTLEDVLEECGYERRGGDWVKPQASHEDLLVAVGA